MTIWLSPLMIVGSRDNINSVKRLHEWGTRQGSLVAYYSSQQRLEITSSILVLLEPVTHIPQLHAKAVDRCHSVYLTPVFITTPNAVMNSSSQTPAATHSLIISSSTAQWQCH